MNFGVVSAWPPVLAIVSILFCSNQSNAATVTHEMLVSSSGSGDYLVSDPGLNIAPGSGAHLVVNGTSPLDFGTLFSSVSPDPNTTYPLAGSNNISFLSITNSGSATATALTFGLLVGIDFRFIDFSAYTPIGGNLSTSAGLQSDVTVASSLCSTTLLAGATCYQAVAARPLTRGGSVFDIGSANDYAIVSYTNATIAPVPLPAGFPLLLTGLLGMVAFSRFRKPT